MSLCFLYLKEKRVGIAFGFLCVMIFFVSFVLYHLPLIAVVYPACLCLVLGIFVLLGEFLSVKKKHEELIRYKNLSVELGLTLPEAKTILEGDYIDWIRHLQMEGLRNKNEAELKFINMIDYYTVWAHQIKTPIASMKLTLQKEDSSVARQLSADLFRIQQYVEMVLAFLRLDSDFSDYVFESCDVDGVIRASLRKFAPEFIQRKLRLQYQPTGLKLISDEKWLAFVLEQILSNALKYTKEGSIKIYQKENRFLCIADTGIGNASQDLPRIFDKGFTGFNGRSSKEASGIGLYLCKQVCDKLGISIWAESQVGVGTMLILDLSQKKERVE